MMCCKAPHIKEKELEKPPGVWCRHAVAGKGCGIYEDRPPVCRRFYCQWMLDSRMGPEWKPDKARFVIFSIPEKKVLNVVVDPDFPNAWTKPPFFAAIKGWAQDGAELGRLVLVRIGARLVVVLPGRIVDLGKVDPSAQLVLTRERGPTGFHYDVDVRSEDSARDTTRAAAPS